MRLGGHAPSDRRRDESDPDRDGSFRPLAKPRREKHLTRLTDAQVKIKRTQGKTLGRREPCELTVLNGLNVLNCLNMSSIAYNPKILSALP